MVCFNKPLLRYLDSNNYSIVVDGVEFLYGICKLLKINGKLYA
jgi:hypothetical protein